MLPSRYGNDFIAKMSLQRYGGHMPEPRVPLTAQSLRGIAHPLRVRLLNLLREDGPSTATRLAERTNESSGATSYHLRQLALYGFVEEDREHAGGRERWWRATSRSTSLEGPTVRSSPAEAEAYLRAVASEYADRVDRWLSGITTLPDEWDEGATLSNWRLRLTSAESTRLLAELEAVIDRFRSETTETTETPATPQTPVPGDAERVVLQVQLMPFLTRPEDRRPEDRRREASPPSDSRPEDRR
jgi:DNA-binding transcriptional ArsR family regulator